MKRKAAFTQKAVDFGLPPVKGVLIIGIPGTGKSLSAKATAAVFNIPLLKLDAGKLYGGLVGQSESNIRSVIQTSEAIAPCCLWIDELEKGFAGSKSSGATDGGTSARVFGSFLNWMQEKTKPVFVVATANDISQLPPELLRKSRFDELWFVDLPNQQEREAIWKIQIATTLTGFVPLSKTMVEQISLLWNWAKGRARNATSPLLEKKLRRIGC